MLLQQVLAGISLGYRYMGSLYCLNIFVLQTMQRVYQCLQHACRDSILTLRERLIDCELKNTLRYQNEQRGQNGLSDEKAIGHLRPRINFHPLALIFLLMDPIQRLQTHLFCLQNREGISGNWMLVACPLSWSSMRWYQIATPVFSPRFRWWNGLTNAQLPINEQRNNEVLPGLVGSSKLNELKLGLDRLLQSYVFQIIPSAKGIILRTTWEWEIIAAEISIFQFQMAKFL